MTCTDTLLSIFYFLFSISFFLFSISFFLFSISFFLFPFFCFLFPFFYFLFPFFYFLISVFYYLLSIFYYLFSISFFLFSISDFLFSISIFSIDSSLLPFSLSPFIRLSSVIASLLPAFLSLNVLSMFYKFCNILYHHLFFFSIYFFLHLHASQTIIYRLVPYLSHGLYLGGFRSKYRCDLRFCFSAKSMRFKYGC